MNYESLHNYSMDTCGVSKLYCADSREQVSSDPQSRLEIAQFGPCRCPGNVEPGINNNITFYFILFLYYYMERQFF